MAWTGMYSSKSISSLDGTNVTQEYHPDDLKGKGDSYLIEKELKDRKHLGVSGTEMTPRHSRNKSTGHDDFGPGPTNPFDDAEASGTGRSNTTGASMGTALKKRFGSIRRRKEDAEA